MNCKTTLLKKNFRLLMLVAGMSLAGLEPANAQVTFGVKGGLSINNLIFDKEEGETEVLSRPGFFVGPAMRLSLLLGGLGLDAAVLYEQRNVRHKSRELVPKGEHATIVKHQQIAVPVNLRYDLNVNDTWGIYAYAGPQVGFNVGKEIRLDYGSYVPADVTVAIDAGIGVMVTNHLQLSAGYHWSCGKTADLWINRGYPQSVKIDKAHINAWQFGIGYFF